MSKIRTYGVTVMRNGDALGLTVLAESIEPNGTTVEFLKLDDHQAIVQKLEERIEKLREVMEFYAQGGHSAMDMWQHPDLGYFTGKRARQALKDDEAGK